MRHVRPEEFKNIPRLCEPLVPHVGGPSKLGGSSLELYLPRFGGGGCAEGTPGCETSMRWKYPGRLLVDSAALTFDLIGTYSFSPLVEVR